MGKEVTLLLALLVENSPWEKLWVGVGSRRAENCWCLGTSKCTTMISGDPEVGGVLISLEITCPWERLHCKSRD